MKELTEKAYEYRVGGALPAGFQTYVEREADDELFDLLLAGSYCYVLNTRQMGKSSLRVRTMARLRERDVVCAEVDLSIVTSTDASKKQWYSALMRRIASSLKLSDRFDIRDWLRQRDELTPSECFGEFLESVVLQQFKEQKIVIFFDEIDSTLKLTFNVDDFFNIIRGCFNRRADQPELNRLTFALLGVADPTDLIQDKTGTPFNIGHAIELRGFTLERARPLALGLANVAARPEEVLRAILQWTNGQPFLTQKICMLISEAHKFIPAGEEDTQVGQMITERIIKNWDATDDPKHLNIIVERILESPKQRTSRLLGIYHQLLKEGKLTTDNSPEQMELRLSGLVVSENGWLKVYNPIYQAIFDEQWVESRLAALRPYSESLRAWYGSGCIDESRLLRGQALRDAQSWVEGKSLSDRDWRFLNASQEVERQEIDKALVAERETLRLQREAQAKLEEALNTESIAKSKAEEALKKEQAASEILKAANDEAQRKASHARRILIGTIAVALLLSAGTAISAVKATRLANAETAKAEAARDREREANEGAQLANERANEAEVRAKESEFLMQSRRAELDAIDRDRSILNAKVGKTQRDLRAAREKLRIAEEESKEAKQAQGNLEARVNKINEDFERLRKECKPN